MSPSFDAAIATKTLTEKTVIDGGHPAVCDAVELEVDGTYSLGQFLAILDDGKKGKYTKATNNFAGILTRSVDSTLDPIGIAMLHGCYVLENCLVAGAAPDAEDIARAAAKGCWAR